MNWRKKLHDRFVEPTNSGLHAMNLNGVGQIMASEPEMIDFISSVEIEAIRLERESWLHQKANDHDERIRADEREKCIVKSIVK